MAKLKFLSIEDLEDNCLRIRLKDGKITGFVKFRPGVYALFPNPNEQEEREIWEQVARLYSQTELEIEMTPEFCTSFRHEFDSGIVAISFDHEAGEITLKENKKPCKLTAKSILTHRKPSRPPISKKSKKSPSSNSRK